MYANIRAGKSFGFVKFAFIKMARVPLLVRQRVSHPRKLCFDGSFFRQCRLL